MERKRQRWLAGHKSDPEPAPWLTDAGLPDQIKAKFLSHKARMGKTPDRIWGVFGEMSGRDGWIEETIKNEDGVFLKIYGCSYLFKGQVPEASVHGIEMAKSILFQVASQLPLFTLLGLGFDFLFRRQKFWTFIDWIGAEVEHKCLRHYNIPPEEYNVFPRELLKAFVLAIFRVWKIDLSRSYYGMDHPRIGQEFPTPQDNFGKNRLGYILARLWMFVVFFLQSDFAYRSRLQDALAAHPKDIRGLLKVLMNRETKFGVGYKWKFIDRALYVILKLEPKLNELSMAFFEFFDFEKAKPDEADIYFSLMYQSYAFLGLPFEQRKLMWEKINEEKNHVFLFHLPEMI